ncbi:hypothetical protein PLESTB_000718600 [Pleodorina starrii]|uniref:Uncharacterized protein n=1 Tax=Pleodorina starrii TaxID=330485 RepID=A0A9W6BKP7_9CHLO|nr:hypothetical protein PLESTM_001708900 [Pleodorina starrii]GLC53196.1 hypothetical protein PLESTB_000718600 [Pleodorina starrii]GLC68651.1 hypothetical protein PLESTF_000719200 [Pleodorina starrii]
MGVANLWTELVKYAHVCRSWNGSARSAAGAGEPRDENAEIVAELCGKVLAIDTSVWLFQCSQQNDLRDAIFDEHARVLYIFIYRIMNLLRYGVTPVFVLEGDTPKAKMGRLNQRSLARGFSGRAVGNRRGGRHDALGRKVVELLDAMGIPHVDAPGEAEAMCAALTVVGLAHAAVTSDVDALLFGAQRVYKECRVQMDSVKLNSVECVDAGEAARRCFGLRQEGAGCVRALQAVACLSGCDYSVSGGKGVGVKTALEAVQQLTVGKQDDNQVLPELLRYLETGPDPRVTALTKCTGCKTCGHEKHGRQPCAICGPGPCRPKADSSPCECEFHRSEPQRKFMRVIARAVTTGPSFSSECRATIAAFESETQRAQRAAEELRRRVGSISWSRRPDTQAVFALMHPLLGHTSSDANKLLWTYPEVRDKMRPVLVEWDMRQGPEPPAAARAVVEFRPRRIKQVAAKDGGLWAYLMEFDRLPDVNPADSAFDCQQLYNSKLVKGRHVRRRLVDRLWPHLLTLREEEEQAKLVAKPKKARGGRAAASGGTGSPGGVSGPSGVTFTAAGGGAAAAYGPAASGGGGVTQSGVSAGSADVMQRFLRMGAAGGGAATAAAATAAAAAPTTSVQQQQQQRLRPVCGAQEGRAFGGAAPAEGGQRQRAAGPASGGGGGGGDGDDDDDDWMDCEEVQMTQRHDGAAAGGAAGPSQPVWGGENGTQGARTAAGVVAPGQGGGGMVALWSDTDPNEEYGGGGDNDDDGRRTGRGEGAGRGAMYDDVDDVIPTSLDELLASASQPADGRGGRRQQGQRADGAARAAAPPPPQRQGRGGAAAQAADAAAAAAAEAGLSNAQPFRPPPTGPGPGRAERAAAAACGGGGSAAAAGTGAGRRPAAAVEVLDLTDSPVCCTAPTARNKSRTCAPAATATTIGTVVTGEEHVLGSREGDRSCRGGAAPPRSQQPLQGQEGREEGQYESYGPYLGRQVPEDVEEQLQPQQPPEEGEEEEAVGSAVKPARRPGGSGVDVGGRQATAGASGRGGDHLGLQPQQRGEQRQQGEQERQQAVSESQGGLAEEQSGPVGSAAGEAESPAARRARLMRSLFPDEPGGGAPAAAAAAAPPPPRRRPADGRDADDDDAGDVKALVRGSRGQQRQQMAAAAAGLLGSPPKRQNTGDGGGGGGGSGGGRQSGVDGDGARRADYGAAATRPTAAAAAAVAEHVDLTLDDDDDDDDVVDLT